MSVKKKKLKQRLTDKYRLVILNEDTLEERVSLKLNKLNVYVIGGILVIALVVLTTLLIAFSPIKEYIPGYSSTKLNKTASDLVIKTDSLEQDMKMKNAYLKNIKNILNGNINVSKIDQDTSTRSVNLNNVNLNASKAETAFREEIEKNEEYSVFENAQKNTELVFFAPIKGKITQAYNLNDKHFAIDIAVAKHTPVKAVANGSVIFSDFTSNTGYVLIIEHAQGFLSVYKHNETLFKEQGDLVQSGEVIANAGTTGELSTGPHLHFELWSDGYPIDPSKFIDFEE